MSTVFPSDGCSSLLPSQSNHTSQRQAGKKQQQQQNHQQNHQQNQQQSQSADGSYTATPSSAGSLAVSDDENYSDETNYTTEELSNMSNAKSTTKTTENNDKSSDNKNTTANDAATITTETDSVKETKSTSDETNGHKGETPNNQEIPAEQDSKNDSSSLSSLIHHHHEPHRHFASLSTPMHRRLQTMMVFWHSVAIPLFTSLSLLAITCFPFIWPVLIPYLFYFVADKAFENGKAAKRYSHWFRSRKMWNYFAAYFPIVLHKTENLPPSFEEKIIYDDYYIKLALPLLLLKLLVAIFPHTFSLDNAPTLKLWRRKPYKKLVPTGTRYLFGYHPHGVAAMGAMGAMATEGAGWSRNFPHIPISLLTLETQFVIPFYRDYLLALGVSSVAKKNIEAILAKHFSVCIVLGGARESLFAKPNARHLILKSRKGFIKIALRTPGIKVVPVFAFGENEVYDIIEPSRTSMLRKFQIFLKKCFGFTIPFFHARGIFNYDFGFLPYRRRIDVVVGKPIDMPYVPDPSNELVAKYHDIYVSQLVELYEANKEKYGYKEVLQID